MSRLLMLVLLGACRGSGDDPSGTTADTDTDTVDTDTETVDTGYFPVAEEEIHLGTGQPDALRVLITGAVASCEAGTATLRAEFLGAIGVAEVTPIVDGALGSPTAMTVTPGSVFRKADASVAADCEATAWRFMVAAKGQASCVVTGPGASEWLVASSEDCELR